MIDNDQIKAAMSDQMFFFTVKNFSVLNYKLNATLNKAACHR